MEVDDLDFTKVFESSAPEHLYFDFSNFDYEYFIIMHRLNFFYGDLILIYGNSELMVNIFRVQKKGEILV